MSVHSLSENGSANQIHNDHAVNSALLAEAVAVPLLFAVIFVVGLVGNATLVFIVLRNKPMRTKPNLLIVSLAVGDFLFLLVSAPFTATFYIFHSGWYLGSGLCKLNEFMLTLSLAVSIFTLTALSVDRFVAIVYPLNAYSSNSLKRVVVASVVIWIVSIGLALMDLVGAHVRPCPQCDKASEVDICDLYPAEWGEGYRVFRIVFRFVVFFVVPLIIIVCLYVIIAIVLLRQSESLASHMTTTRKSLIGTQLSSDNEAVVRQIESRRRIAKVVLSFVVIFVVCWLPRHVFVLCFHFAEFEFDMSWHVFKIISFCLTFIYSCVNPLALFLLNAEYRRYYRHYLFGCCYAPWRLQNSRRRPTTNSDSIPMQTTVTNGNNLSLEDQVDENKTPQVYTKAI